MSSSTKIVTTRAGLHGMIEKAWSAKIADQQARLDKMADEGAFLGELETWRTAQKQRVTRLAGRIRSGKVEDAELSNFTLADAPSRPNKWDVSRAEDQLHSLTNQAERALSRFEGLKWPDSGEREFTEAQLVNLFGV